jgi:type I restriction enzyme R subunit
MPDPTYESEWLTRKKRIDTRLRALGWQIVPFDADTPLSACTKHAVEEFPTDTGPADYALCVKGRILGIVEAKKLSLGPQNVLVQAERYSRGATTNTLSFGEFRVPFLYSTNGEVIWFHDVRHNLNLSRRIADLPTPAAMEEMLTHQFDAACAKLLEMANNHPLSPLPALSNCVKDLASDPATKIEAIKVHREETGASLAQAKKAVDSFTTGKQG